MEPVEPVAFQRKSALVGGTVQTHGIARINYAKFLSIWETRIDVSAGEGRAMCLTWPLRLT